MEQEVTLKPLSISIVMGPFFPTMPGPCGAVEMVWQGLAEEFAQKGHDVRIYCKSWPGQAPSDVINGVRYFRRTNYTSGKSIYWNLVKDMLYSLRRFPELPSADVVITNVFWLPAMVARFKKRAGHVVMNVQRQPKGQYWMYNGVSRLAAVSQSIRDSIVRENLHLDSATRVFPNPVNIHVFRPPERERGVGPERTILYTGRIHPEKGVHVLVDAFRLLSRERAGLRLRVVGPSQIERGGGGPEYVERLVRAAEGLNVEFMPPIYERPRLAQVIADADYYTYPTLAEQGEALPVAPLEAMACGLAPVVSAIPQFRDYLYDGVNGLVFDHTSADPARALADAFLKLIDDPDKAREMGERAAEKARGFGFSAVADLYLADFYDLLAQGAAARRHLPKSPEVVSAGLARVEDAHANGTLAITHTPASAAQGPRERLRTMQQEGRTASPWSKAVRLKVMLWHLVWLSCFRTTPKPLNFWRLFLLRLFGATIDGKPYIAASVLIRMPWHLEICEGACVNYGADLYTLGRIKLGPRCTVAQGVYLCTGTHDMTDPTYPLVVGDIDIGEEAFLGVRALIMPGVKVHAGAIVGAGAVVTRDVPAWTVVAGNPAKVIKAREFKGRAPVDPTLPSATAERAATLPSPPATVPQF